MTLAPRSLPKRLPGRQRRLVLPATSSPRPCRPNGPRNPGRPPRAARPRRCRRLPRRDPCRSECPARTEPGPPRASSRGLSTSPVSCLSQGRLPRPRLRQADRQAHPIARPPPAQDNSGVVARTPTRCRLPRSRCYDSQRPRRARPRPARPPRARLLRTRLLGTTLLRTRLPPSSGRPAGVRESGADQGGAQAQLHSLSRCSPSRSGRPGLGRRSRSQPSLRQRSSGPSSSGRSGPSQRSRSHSGSGLRSSGRRGLTLSRPGQSSPGQRSRSENYRCLRRRRRVSRQPSRHPKTSQWPGSQWPGRQRPGRQRPLRRP
jgi:hypothetical protein